ncbi:MAG: hypothetical protein OXE95_08690 [Chloroflexi bacterium]|nr:hypothetical protein [Chloroflexota bacterium]MCY4247636.1 hypothetical protein [Chloroflexota bacterium]
MDIKRVLDSSYHDALRALVMGTSPAALARARERVFIKALAARLLASCGDENARVFHAFTDDWRTVFGAAGPAGDIRVCRISQAETDGRQPQPVQFVAEAVCFAAIDFTRETASALRAVNRLNMGAAQSKLLALARPKRGDAGLRDMLKGAFTGEAHCLAMLPHPTEWDDAHEAPAVWQLQAGEWRALA